MNLAKNIEDEEKLNAFIQKHRPDMSEYDRGVMKISLQTRRIPNLQQSERERWRLTEELRKEHELEPLVFPATATLTLEQFKGSLEYLGSYTRLEYIVDVYFNSNIKKSDWFKVLGFEWNCFDNFAQYKEELTKIFNDAPREDLNLMMDEEAQAKYDALPDKVTIYRGCHDLNEDGLSWTLSKKVAEKMTSLNRYVPGKRLKSKVITETIDKSFIVAVMLDKQEQEVIRTYN